MEMNVRDDQKLVEIWLTNAEKIDPVLREGLKEIYAKYKTKKYMVAVFESGKGDLYENTRDLLLFNRRRSAEKTVQQAKKQRATGLADLIVIEEYKGQKIDDILKYGVEIFAIGSDWEGYFDYLNEFCKVVYLPRTEGISSTQIRKHRPVADIGIIGTGSIASRFASESAFVNSARITGAYNPLKSECDDFCKKFNIPTSADSVEELLQVCDAVYIASPHYTHFDYAETAMRTGKHVFCETPFVTSRAEAEKLYDMAQKKGLVLMTGLKTAYCPAVLLYIHVFNSIL